jgi:hypothetical protein
MSTVNHCCGKPPVLAALPTFMQCREKVPLGSQSEVPNAPILIHFLVNAVHFIGFTYPRLAG